jgi:amino acid adenylation domain-containing protein
MKLYFIGSSSLLRHCMQQALESGFTILGVVSTDSDIKTWAQKNHIPQITLTQLHQQPKHFFDYLISVVNDVILKKRLLELPKMGTLNFHDAPLPRYSGVHATSWAIINGEKKHAITWHMVDEGIDTGAIVEQVAVPTLDDDTAYAFNLRCFDTAAKAFSTVLKKIKSGALQPIPQDLSKRTYYAYAQKPTYNGIIDWSWPAERIHRLVKTTDFGPHPNDFSSAKCCIDGQWFIISSICISDRSSHSKQDTSLEMDDHHFCFNTGSRVICIHELVDLKGQKIDLEQLTAVLKRKGINCFNTISTKAKKDFQTLSEQIFKAEKFWVRELKEIQLTVLPYTLSDTTRSTVNWSINSKLYATLTKKFPSTPISSILFASVMLYLYRITQQDKISAALYEPIHDPLVHSSTKGLLINKRPFNLTAQSSMSINDWITYIHERYTQLTAESPYLGDVFYRYHLEDTLSDLITIYVSNQPRLPVELKSSLVLHITPKGGMHWFIPKQEQSRSPIVRIVKHLEYLLQKMVDHPDISIDHISIVPLDEQVQIQQLNQTKFPFPSNETLYELFLEQVKNHTHKKAIIGDATPLSYGQLWQQVKTLAHLLTQKGIQKGDYVGIWMNRSSEAIMSMLAVTAIGAAYVPLRVKDPVERLKIAIRKAPIQYLLVRQEDLSDRTIPNTIPLNVTKLLQNNSISNFQYKPFPSSNIAYVNYTSGTTGEPKGIMVSHRNVIRLVKNQNYFDFSSHQTIAHLADLAFDATTFEIWGALLNGNTVCVIASEVALMPERLKESFDQCTTLFMTTALLQRLIEQDVSIFDHLSYILFGGERCRADIIKSLMDWRKTKNKSFNLIHVYGPTENTTFSTYFNVKSIPQRAKTLPIGKPVRQTTSLIFDKYQQLLPLGVTGELYLGGRGLSKGYLKNVRETHRCFTNTSFGRMYKTGDLAYIDPNTLEISFQGRIDFQVKLRGFRIELSDIQTHLLSHPTIKEALVHLVTSDFRPMLVAFIIPLANKTPPNDETLKAFLKQCLPEYMIPSQFITLRAWPITHTGKVDYKRLTRIANMQPVYDEMSQRQTHLLVQLVEKYLRVSGVEGHQSYKSLGGDSITTMQIVAQAKRQGLIIDPMVLLEAASLNDVLRLAHWKQGVHLKTEELMALSNKLSPIQYWFFRQDLLNTNVFNHQVLLHLKRRYTDATLLDFFNRLIKAHPILSARFHTRPFHIAFTNTRLNEVKRVKTTTCTYADDLKGLSDQLNHAIDITQGRLIQIGRLISQDRYQEHHLVVVIHHLVIDGVSWRILLEDLGTLMEQAAQHRPLVLLKETYSYLDWIQYLHQIAPQFYIQKEVNYWLDQSPKTNHSTDLNHTEHESGEYSEIFSNTLKYGLRQGLYVNDHHYSPFIVLLAQTVQALSIWQKKIDIYLTLESHGRHPLQSNLDISRTIGWFTTLYPFHIRLSDKLTDQALLKLVQDRMDQMPNRGMGYVLLKELQPCRSLQTTPHPEISFNYLGDFDHLMIEQLKQYIELDESGIQLKSAAQ